MPAKEHLPILISVPHGGTMVPDIVRSRLMLSDDEIGYYCDPLTRDLFGFRGRAAAYIDTTISRMVVDLNRPPLPLPLRDPDGVIKLRTIDGRAVWRPGLVPGMPLIHRLMMEHYFPYHQRIDELIDHHGIRIAFDCHSMLPAGSPEQKDAGRPRPLICLGNNGDVQGRAKKVGLATCSRGLVKTLADLFTEAFPGDGAVAINNPFSGGFIANAHFWRKGIPWIQIEVNRTLYEGDRSSGRNRIRPVNRVPELREKIWNILSAFQETAGL